MKFVLEICVDSVHSALAAQAAGASRIELCSSLQEGGITPSHGTVTEIRRLLKIDINVLIRPRAGDFLYSDAEFEIMRRDIEFCRDCGINGIVTGLLMPDGGVDVDRTSELVKTARPMSVTFHRAFDMCADPLTALENIIKTGAGRLLTSGQQMQAAAGASLISDLIGLAGDRIIIMPGSGINETNITELALKTGAREFHLSAGKTAGSGMQFRKEGIRMGNSREGGEYSVKVADQEIITTVRRLLEAL